MKLKKNSTIIVLKSNLATAFELPKEIMLNLPLITFTGRNNMLIENYKNIIEYNPKKIRISTTEGIICIEGDKLTLKEMSKNQITVMGKISNFCFL